MDKIRDGVMASIAPLALILLAHFTLHKPDPPLWHAFVFVTTWVFVGIVVHTSDWPRPVFWRAVAWSMLTSLLVSVWGSYWDKNVYLTLGIPMLVCGFLMAPVSRWIDQRRARPR